ncbi:hypothetical protein ATCCBAA256_17710 [Mycobacterium montefiorense]|nr:hypothetical protein ATCCBAA256_17710 [Mycobacterium montefiorense]
MLEIGDECSYQRVGGCGDHCDDVTFDHRAQAPHDPDRSWRQGRYRDDGHTEARGGKVRSCARTTGPHGRFQNDFVKGSKLIDPRCHRVRGVVVDKRLVDECLYRYLGHGSEPVSGRSYDCHLLLSDDCDVCICLSRPRPHGNIRSSRLEDFGHDVSAGVL